jgi:hypothetical protein
MYVKPFKSQSKDLPDSWLLGVLEFRKLSPVCEWKVEKRSLQPFCDRPRILLVRHSFSNSEVLGLLCRVIVVNVEYRMLPQFSRSGCEAVGQFCSQSHTGTGTLLGPKGEDMSALRRLRIFWIPWVTMMVVGCFSDAVAQREIYMALR